MIKYSTRGLVKSGIISPLFEKLYCTLIVAFIVTSLSIVFSGYLKNKDSQSNHRIEQICLSDDDKILFDYESWKPLAIRIWVNFLGLENYLLTWN